MSPRAYLVVGPESSGTRLLTKLLIAAGCYGDPGHDQRLDEGFPNGDESIAWRRSLPHRRHWPDLETLIDQVRLAGYRLTVLVMSRDWHALAASQLAAPHVPDLATARRQTQEAYRLIFQALAATGVDYELVNYEAIVSRPQQAIAALFDRLGLAWSASVAVYDGNAKQYQETPYQLGGLEVERVRKIMLDEWGLDVPARFASQLAQFVTEMSQ